MNRFVWLALSIVFPFVALGMMESHVTDEDISRVGILYLILGLVSEIVLICFTISSFLKNMAVESHKRELQLKAERDEDIKKWRKIFLEDYSLFFEEQRQRVLKDTVKASTEPSTEVPPIGQT